MEKEPTKRRRAARGKVKHDVHGQAIRFLLNVVNATIYSSGEDYPSAVQEFFPQVQALGQLIGATSIDEVSQFLRAQSRW